MATCKVCGAPLTVLIQRDDDEENDGYLPDASSSASKPDVLVDDDVELLQCGCHFHWCSVPIACLYRTTRLTKYGDIRLCLLDSYTFTECPCCGKNLTTITEQGAQQVLCNIKNEGGYQAGLDILPLLTEECYLKTFPDERRARAFLEFCREGDVEAIVGLLGDEDADEEEEEEDGEGEGCDDEKCDETEKDRIDVLRYQDSIGSMESALHIAIRHSRTEVAWLLLLLASTMPTSEFPPEVLQTAEQLQLSREEQRGKVDIRTLKDERGMTAADVATILGGIWNDWLISGRLIA